MTKLLLIEDDHDISQLIQMNLSMEYPDISHFDHGRKGFEAALTQAYDLIILDVMLPEMDGIEICRTLRAKEVQTPIIMLTARDSETDRVLGLEMGADDYLTKPFSIRELQARVKAQLRRVKIESTVHDKREAEADEAVIEYKDLSICHGRREVILRGEPCYLTSREFDLLYYLVSRPGHVFDRNALLDAVWGYQHSGYEHTVNSHINRLRNKIELDPANPEYVHTVWGVGYKFQVD